MKQNQQQKSSHREGEIERIARDSLRCIESVGDKAEAELRAYRGPDAGAFTTINTFTSPEQVTRIGDVGRSTREQLEALAREPVISRVCYEDENGREQVIFITRSSPPSSGAPQKIASYRSPLGRLAALPAGAEAEIQLGGKTQFVEIKNSAKLNPKRPDGRWDSISTEIDRGRGRKTSIESLLALIEAAAPAVIRDLVAEMLEEEEPNVRDGLRKAVLTHMGLRDQPILDQYQDEIFRLPLNSRCFLSGPPGTGKTTTLIKRVGQKLDLDELERHEAILVREPLVDHAPEHKQSWIMFSPTELLRLYVKEAFAKEGVPASDQHIRTWDGYRRHLARDVLGLLRKSSGGGSFILREEASYLAPSCYTSEARDWYGAFDEFFTQSITQGLHDDARKLSKSRNPPSVAVGEKLAEVLDRHNREPIAELVPDFTKLAPDIREAVASVNGTVQSSLNFSLNSLLHADREFLDKFGNAASKLLTARDQVEGEFDDEAVEEEIDEEEDVLPASGRRLTRREAISRYYRVIRSAGIATARGQKVSRKSLNGQLLDWLGVGRMPDKEALADIGRNVIEAGRLSRFSAVHSTVLRRIPTLYKIFRRSEKTDWYEDEPAQGADITWAELDLLILKSLRVASQMLLSFRQSPSVEVPQNGIFGRVLGTYKNQVLVDEASDFSVLQLASMYELSNPVMRSFFACGDFNQRLTSWGITSNDDIDWIVPGIERRRITTSYRQTSKLVQLAKRVAMLGGADASDIALPDRVDQEGFDPIWIAEQDDYAKIASWIARRVREVESNVRSLPTIAVLVHDESQVEPMAKVLKEELTDMNLAAVACRDGHMVGNERDVRVFNLQHIKGMEFEAVFFVDLDKIVARYPDLYSKYLYVGATRAATYLGATFSGAVPEPLRSLESNFRSNWAL